MNFEITCPSCPPVSDNNNKSSLLVILFVGSGEMFEETIPELDQIIISACSITVYYNIMLR